MEILTWLVTKIIDSLPIDNHQLFLVSKHELNKPKKIFFELELVQTFIDRYNYKNLCFLFVNFVLRLLCSIPMMFDLNYHPLYD